MSILPLTLYFGHIPVSALLMGLHSWLAFPGSSLPELGLLISTQVPCLCLELFTCLLIFRYAFKSPNGDKIYRYKSIYIQVLESDLRRANPIFLKEGRNIFNTCILPICLVLSYFLFSSYYLLLSSDLSINSSLLIT